MKRLSGITVKLITADFFLHSGWGLIAPIFAIFITDQIPGGSLEVVAFAVASYWIVKSTAQPFIANVLDLIRGEKDDFDFLVYGTYINALVPLGYFFATQVWHIFLLEIVRGLAMACIVPAWYGIFTRHISKGWEAFSWSIQSTSLGFATGFAAAFGGLVATFLGFRTVFILIFILKIISATLLFYTRKSIFQKSNVN
jgi:MFS transporter, DHA2 family, multidrug resistance protein